MEKHTPHCKLAVIKSLVEMGKVRSTHAARLGASELGLSLSDMLAVVMALTPADFHKSMTTHADYRVWQDVWLLTLLNRHPELLGELSAK